MKDDAAGPHLFHIPVMGTGFMIDAPLKVAPYGISSVISLVDDVLIEQMRRFHCEQAGEPYEAIDDSDGDARARRITSYLDLLDRLVQRRTDLLRLSAFEPGSEITRYFTMLPDGPLAAEYRLMLATTDTVERDRLQSRLRAAVKAGSIDVNIMAKGDREHNREGVKLPATASDASAALRGYAQSGLRSAIVFSAGMNPRLYSYAASFPDFLPDENGNLKKRIVVKVSDFHSAVVQGKYLARRGLWVSEFRVESGLNCGGHAFATKGLLLGPILAEFHRERDALVALMFTSFAKALHSQGRPAPDAPPPLRITAQGGIGTAEEDRLLRDVYGVDGTGWATPFLLVPEVTNVDEALLEQLCSLSNGDVYLSDSSPFGLPFWNLRNSASEEARRRRIAEGHPGSACTRGYVRLFNTEFTSVPICVASRQYQKQKLAQLENAEMTDEQRAAQREAVLVKSCICHDLAGGATIKLGIDPAATPAVCCGPNIVNFGRIATLDEMVGHIYGRLSLLVRGDRPHMFLREITLYLDYLRKRLEDARLGLDPLQPDDVREYAENMVAGIEHYRQLAGTRAIADGEAFLAALDESRAALRQLLIDWGFAPT